MKVIGLIPRTLSIIFACCYLFFFICTPPAHAQNSLTYPLFPTSAGTGLQVNGNSSIVTSGNTNFLQLTLATGGQVGSAWYTNPAAQPPAGTPTTLPLSGGFSTTFTFQFTEQGGIVNADGKTGADGVAFVVQNGAFTGEDGDTTSGAFAVGPANGLGGEIGFSGLSNSVAVQFDTWCNTEYNDTCAASGSPTSADQITVESCGAAANTVVHPAPGAVGCQFGTVDLSTLKTPIYIGDTNVHFAQITYTPPPPGATFAAGACTIGEPPNSGGCGSLAITVDSQLVLTVPFNLGYINGYTDSTDSAYVGFTGETGGAYEMQNILSWTLGPTIIQPFNLSGTTTSNFGSNGNENQQGIDTSNANGDLTCNTQGGGTNGCGGVTLATTNTLVSNNPSSGTASWPQYVVGTPWAPSVCAGRPANGGGNPCSLFVNQCYGGSTLASPTQASDFYCPMVMPSASGLTINLADTFDPPPTMQNVPNGTTVSLMDFTPTSGVGTWMPFTATSSLPSNPVCTNVSGMGTPPAAVPTQCDVIDSLVDVYGDQTTTRGKEPKKGWLISVFDVPMPVTGVEVLSNTGCPNPNPALNDPNPNKPDFGSPTFAANIWNNKNCLLNFVVYPAVIPNSISSNGSNNFQAAPPAVLFWGQSTPPVQPGTIPPNGDTVYYNPSPVCTLTYPCTPSNWNIATANNVNILLSSLGADGPHTIHYSSADLVGISEKNIQLITSGTCYNPASISPSFTPPCYNTSYFTTQVNIDSQPPTITSNGFSPAGTPPGTFTLNEKVYPIITCTDQTGLSGVQNCGGVSVGTPGTATACPTSAVSVQATTPLSTTQLGPQTYTATATDCANNPISTTINYTVVSNVNLQINTIPLLTLPDGIPGLLPVAYGAAITNTTPGTTANDVTVTTTFSVPAGTGILLGTPSATISTVTCSNTPCTLKGITISSTPCSISGTTVSCSVASLSPISSKTGLWMEIIMPIAKNSKTGKFTSTSTVTSAGGNLNPNPSVSQTYNVIF